MEAKIDFLKYAISYNEDRINKVDNKSNILIAIQAGSFAAITWVIEKIFLANKIFINESYILLAANALLSALTICLLLQTIRPSNFFVGIFTKKSSSNIKSIIWPNKLQYNFSQFQNQISQINENDIISEYYLTLNAVQNLVFRKYKPYRFAVALMKVQVFLVFIAIIVLSLAKYFKIAS